MYYAKNSFDRFGDDLCESILSYLSFEQKVMFECVCKQWKRCIYSQQKELRIEHTDGKNSINLLKFHDQDVNHYRFYLNKALAKCENLESFKSSYYFDDMLNIVALNCPLIKHISIKVQYRSFISEESLMKFGEISGKRLERIAFSGFNCVQFNISDEVDNDPEILYRFLEYCPNIVSLYERHLSLSIANNMYFAKLTTVMFNLIGSISVTKFATFTDRYFKQINVLKLSVYCDGIGKVAQQLSRYRNLTEFELEIDVPFMITDDCGLHSAMKLMAKNCADISSLKLTLNAQFNCAQSVLELFSGFTRLTKFSIHSKQNQINFGSFESMVNVNLVSHLKLNYNQLSDAHLYGINHCFPELKTFAVNTEQLLTDNTLQMLAQIKSLSKVRLMCPKIKNDTLSDTGVLCILNNCPYIKVIYFRCQSVFTDNVFIALNNRAKQLPKVNFKFTYLGTESKNSVNFNFQRNLMVTSLSP